MTRLAAYFAQTMLSVAASGPSSLRWIGSPFGLSCRSHLSFSPTSPDSANLLIITAMIERLRTMLAVAWLAAWAVIPTATADPPQPPGTRQSVTPPATTAPPTTAQIDFFESKVRPLLIEHCYECHSKQSDQAGGELLLDTAASTLIGGSRGAAIAPGDPQHSLLMRAIGYQDVDLQMPPDGQLETVAIDVLRQWIEMGAPDPRAGASVRSSSPLDRDPATHWAFVPPVKPTLPLPGNSVSSDPIDALADLAASKHQLRPNPIADKATLIGRLYYDLTGLAPSYLSVNAFIASDRPDAYTRLVDQLLASPEFGERFARHWLDVSRYANTLGYATGNTSREYEGSERFRDWAIGAFASDMPYDEMLRHQLAGDRTDPLNENGNLDAMGFLTLGRQFLNGFDTLDDRIDVITRGLLGMTVACARCHDHKFDPIPTADYYSMAGIITSSEKPSPAASPMMLADKQNPADHPILIRGQPGNNGPPAPRQFLTALRKPNEPPFTDGSGRWELAQRIGSADNPLTARVMVNRIWGHLIGKPLVATPSDFGFRTEPPAVPEILDELAVEFAGHWSIKRIIRRIVLSRIYRQSAVAGDQAVAVDPENRWLTRAVRKRRDFESLRDCTLWVAGSLDRSLGGVPVEIDQPQPNPRRTIYARIERQNLPAVFRTFDFASPDTHSPNRYFTTVPQQSLFLMNNHQMLTLARDAAARIRSRAPSEQAPALAAESFRLILGRQPTAEETESAIRFLRQPIEKVADPRTVWAYGTATIDADSGPTNFAPLTVFQKGRWQAAADFPAAAPLGHAKLDRSGGHAPSKAELAVVRRFTAPFAGTIISIQGTVGHRDDNGDGVGISIWIDGRRTLEDTVHQRQQKYELAGMRIEPGQTIDFAVSPGQTDSFDAFTWSTKIQVRRDDGGMLSYDSTRDFFGPLDSISIEPVDRLSQLAHALMMTNEFAFVD